MLTQNVLTFSCQRGKKRFDLWSIFSDFDNQGGTGEQSLLRRPSAVKILYKVSFTKGGQTMSQEKIIVISGKLTKHREVGGFFGTLRGMEIAKHMEKPVEVTTEKDGYRITVYIKEYPNLKVPQDYLLHVFPEFKVLEPA